MASTGGQRETAAVDPGLNTGETKAIAQSGRHAQSTRCGRGARPLGWRMRAVAWCSSTTRPSASASRVPDKLLNTAQRFSAKDAAAMGCLGKAMLIVVHISTALALQLGPALVLPTRQGGKALPRASLRFRHGSAQFLRAAQESPWEWQKREIGKILRFSLPALSIPLADPIMSLVDSVCVGQCASTLELAALGPNLVIFNFVTFSFSFLAIGTTLRVSSALADNDRAMATNTISTALLIAGLSGVLLVTFMLSFSQPTLAATGAVPEILSAAGGYLLVRIWACPAVLATTVLQAGLLAQRDSVTCLLAVVVSAAFNIIGDIVLISQFKMGLVGAAWATMAGNYLSLAVRVVPEHTRLHLPTHPPARTQAHTHTHAHTQRC